MRQTSKLKKTNVREGKETPSTSKTEHHLMHLEEQQTPFSDNNKYKWPQLITERMQINELDLKTRINYILFLRNTLS